MSRNRRYSASRPAGLDESSSPAMFQASCCKVLVRVSLLRIIGLAIPSQSESTSFSPVWRDNWQHSQCFWYCFGDLACSSDRAAAKPTARRREELFKVFGLLEYSFRYDSRHPNSLRLNKTQIRTIYRVVEFALGIFGYPFTHEWPLYVLESGPMFIAMAILAMYHPTRLLADGYCRTQTQAAEKV